MDKISSILPSNPRLKSVDLKASQPVRPGVPTFGRPQGVTIKDRVSLSSNAPLEAAQDTMIYRNPKEARQSKIVQDMSKRFFETRLDPAPVIKGEDSLNALEMADEVAPTAAINRPAQVESPSALESKAEINPLADVV